MHLSLFITPQLSEFLFCLKGILLGKNVGTSHLLAILNNTALGLFARRGETNLPQAQRMFAYQLDRALAQLAS